MVIPEKNSCKEICVDFDGTLYDRKTTEPYFQAVESLKWFRRWGYTIIILSGRANSPTSIVWMKQWLNDHKICFDEVTNTKPSRLQWLIDDRGIHFQDNWTEITETIKQHIFPWKQPKS